MNNTRPTVWVLKEQVINGSTGSRPMDYTPAYEYGDVRFITEFDLPLHPNSTVAKSWYESVMAFIQEFDPTHDFVITTGQPLAIFMLGMVMGTLGVVPNVLVWKREQNRYVVYKPTPIDSPIDI